LSGNAKEAFGQAYGALLNRASGAQEVAVGQRFQAERDLADFDRQYGEQLNLGSNAFVNPESSTGFTGDTGTLAALQELVAATQMVASNTATTTGPSMEAGLSS